MRSPGEDLSKGVDGNGVQSTGLGGEGVPIAPCAAAPYHWIMSLFDNMKDMAEAARKAAAEHPDQVKSALSRLEEVVDDKTGGQHHDQIAQAKAKADAYIDEQSSTEQ